MSNDFDEIKKMLAATLKLAAEAKEENIALQAVCGALIAELAIKHPDPRAEVDRICTSLRGLAAAVATGTEGKSIAHTKVIERIAETAELGLEHIPRR